MATIDQIKNYKGQITKKEVELLSEMASKLPENALIVEIGSYKGKSSASIAHGMPKSARLLCIDPWIQLKHKTEQGYDTLETVKDFDKQTKDWQPRVIQAIGYPLEVANFIGEIDMLAIDSVKKYDQIKPIWQVFFPKVKKGGIICSHDYDPNPESDQYYEGVVNTIEEIVKPNTKDHGHIDWTFTAIKK